MALYEPGYGYYVAGAQKFGEAGDFVTAPHVSTLFGACVAEQVKEVLLAIDGGVLELGAGDGALASSVLIALKDTPPQHYYILEPGAELQHRQRNRLAAELPAALFERVVWLDTLPEQFKGVCLANEVMDALPTDVFVKRDGAVQQLLVDCNEDALTYATRMANDELSEAVAAIEADRQHALPEGYQSEVCWLLNPWIKALSDCMKKGVVLLCDYGYPRQEYYRSERSMGTLACYYRHRQHTNPFFYPGLQDITAHVDFTRLVESASEAGLALLGYTSQSRFLMDCGISALAAERMENCATERAQLTLAREIKTLTLPGEMGERFQVMALGKNMASPLQGFKSHDLSYRL